MNSTSAKILTVGLLFIACATVQAQSDPFSNRLQTIEYQLTLMSDSLVPGLNEVANFSVSALPIQSFLRIVAESHKLNVQIDPELNVSLTNNFTNVLVKDLIYFICEEYKVDVRFTGTIMSFYKYLPPPVPKIPTVRKKLSIDFKESTGLITVDFVNDTLSLIVKEITRITNKNVIVAGGREIENKLVSGFIKELPLESALDKLAYINGLKVARTRDGIFVLEPSTPGVSASKPANANMLNPTEEVTMQDSLISVDALNFPLAEVINRASVLAGVNFILFSDIVGNTSAKVKSVTYDELLTFLFQGSNLTYKKSDNVYLIGSRTQEGFRSTELVSLDFRTTENILSEIPAELLKEVDLKIHKELNSLIVTGNKHKINEVISFVKLIDKPIPNILIEVIVADVRKGYSITTGIRAVLGADSIPKTQGQIFPGLDATFSPASINNALAKLDSKGIVNLGRVTPNFYIQLKALEDNNNIQVRSTPQLSTMNGSKANLTIGKSVYYIETTQNITGGVNPITSQTQQFNKVEANLAINISPVVSGNEHITLDITAEFSDFLKPEIVGAPPGNTTRKFESKIRVKNEEMIILGGLEETSKSESSSGVPLLSRIPILKWLFSSRSKSRTNNRLVVFIKPTLVY